MARVLIIDDDPMVCEMLSQAIAMEGHEPASAGTLEQGTAMARGASYDVVFLDVRLPDGNGLQAMPDLKAAGPGREPPEVIIITAEGDADGAELAITNGAWDYLQKPAGLRQMTLPLLRALEYRAKRSRPALAVFHREGIVGACPAMRACVETVARAAATEASVLISGETGTGKELFARAIHANSRRRDKPFVVVDCAAMPASILESELFGSLRGAFTGADRDREGLIGQAHGGTLFLDEVGELPLQQQRAFLRVLQERRYRPLGATGERPSDFRLVAATNRDLAAMTGRGEFREDLLFRIRTVGVDLPPLRGRGRDVRELAMRRIAELCERYGMDTKGFSPGFFEILEAYGWPGNVRELFHVLERTLVAAGPEPVLFAKHLPDEVRVAAARSRVDRDDAAPGSASAPGPQEELPPWREYRDRGLAELERAYLNRLLELAGGNVTRAASRAGLSRQRLYALLRKHGLRKHWQSPS
jgi:two-component system NtrC family response regulator